MKTHIGSGYKSKKFQIETKREIILSYKIVVMRTSHVSF